MNTEAPADIHRGGLVLFHDIHVRLSEPARHHEQVDPLIAKYLHGVVHAENTL